MQEKANKSVILLDTLTKEQQELTHKVNLLRPQSLDPDILEERAHKYLSIAHRNEYVIYLDQNNE